MDILKQRELTQVLVLVITHVAGSLAPSSANGDDHYG